MKEKQHTIVDGEINRRMEVIELKVVKPVQIPMNVLLCALRDSKPRYIAKNGVRVNILEVAASLIESLIAERDEAEANWEELAQVVGRMLTDMCELTDLTVEAGLCFGTASLDAGSIQQDNQDTSRYPKATVISALVKHEMV